MRLLATEWMEHLDAARELALAGDAEGVHQVRVSLRRLRVWLSFSKGHRALHRDLRWLCRALALQRDLDVFEVVLSAQALAALREEAMGSVLEALQSERWGALRGALEQVKAPRRGRAKRALERFEARLSALREGVSSHDGESLHALRRGLRRVRYAREWLGQDTTVLANEQETLGALCDLLAVERFAQEHGAQTPDSLRAAIDAGFSLVVPVDAAR